MIPDLTRLLADTWRHEISPNIALISKWNNPPEVCNSEGIFRPPREKELDSNSPTRN